MRTHLAACLLALAGLSFHARAEDAPPSPESKPAVVRLAEAVKKGLVAVRAKAEGTYSRLRLALESRSGRDEEIDVSGESFEPLDGSSCQRLGIGPVTAAAVEAPEGAQPSADVLHRNASGDGSARVRVPAGRTVVVEASTCCLDLRRSVPRAQTMRLAARPLAPKLEALFRRWADLPETPQSVVNSAVWQGDWDADLRPHAEAARAKREAGGPKPREGVAAQSFGGVVHVLRDGELRAVDPDGNVRFLGTGILSFAVEPDGVWVTSAGADGKVRLWRVPMTHEDAPRSVATLAADDHDIRRVLPFAKGRAVILPVASLFVKPDGETEHLLDEVASIASCRVDEKGRLVAACEGAASGAGAGRWVVLVIDGPGAKPVERFRLMNVPVVRVTPAGIHALSEDGELERVRLTDGKRVGVDRSKRVRRIVGASATTLWLDIGDWTLEACDPETGRARQTLRIPQGVGDDPPSADPVTGDLVWTEGLRVHRYVLATGARSEVPDRPE
ncbi:MAG: hypothetical protein HMLKMBBP_03815 [Planctomycetes bacterium]|nr:hypothetical protein [Planctomycetota bacterium]